MAGTEEQYGQGPMDVDLDVVRKYDRPGPRYTSYPTAPHFHSGFSEDVWMRHIREANTSAERPLSLYFHIPFCDTLCWFCGCTMMVERHQEPIARYMESLYKEMDLYAALIHPDREVVQVHFGGGTPTHLSPSQLRAVGRKIHDTFRIAQDAEISIEIDPRGLTREHVEALKDVGFNRASVGVQDFDPVVQQAINRVHDEKLVGQVIDWIRDAGFVSLNLDLIYGLPFQSENTFTKTIEQILAFAPDRLAVFSYAHVPWLKAHQKLIKDETMPSPEEKLGMLKLIVETLTGRGYRYIGMDHFALENDGLAQAQRAGTLQRNFQGYSTHAGTDIQAFGMSSISQLPRAYAQHTKDMAGYHEAIAAGRLPLARGVELSRDDVARRHIIMRIMCDMGLDYSRMSADLGVDFETVFHEELEALTDFEADGLLVRHAAGVEVTQVGRLLIRNIAMVFDTYLEENRARYSRTV